MSVPSWDNECPDGIVFFTSLHTFFLDMCLTEPPHLERGETPKERFLCLGGGCNDKAAEAAGVEVCKEWKVGRARGT